MTARSSLFLRKVPLNANQSVFRVDGIDFIQTAVRVQCAMTVLATVVFVNMVVNIGAVKSDDGLAYCMPLQPAVDAMHILSIVDLAINVIAPNVVIVGLYVAIAVHLTAWRCRRRRVISRLVQPGPSGEEDRVVCQTEIRLTRTSFLLSAVIVLLSTPWHALRAAYVVAELFRFPVPPQIGGGTLLVVVRELFYASYAVPFFVVVASHSRIRWSIVLWVQLALRSAWKRLPTVSFCCSWHVSSSLNTEQRPPPVAVKPDTL